MTFNDFTYRTLRTCGNVVEVKKGAGHSSSRIKYKKKIHDRLQTFSKLNNLN